MRTIAVIAFVTVFGLAACDEGAEPDPAFDGAAPAVTQDETALADTDFDTLDVNGDSQLDVDEVAEWVDDAGLFREWDSNGDSELDRDEIHGNAFELWDADGNGTVSETEWDNATELWYPAGAQPAAFSDVDSDGDSALDLDEFSERVDLSPAGESWTAETLQEETFKNAYFELYDTNNDGRVSEDEWTHGSAVFGTPDE